MKVVAVALGKRINGEIQFKSSFVRDQIESLKYLGIEIIDFGINDTRTPHGLLRNVIKLRNLIRFKKPDIVHAHYGSSTALIAVMGSVRLAPVVVSYCGSDLLGCGHSNIKDKLRAKVATIISKLCATKVTGIIVKSRNLFESLPFEARKKSVIQPNGVDLKLFDSIDQKVCRKLLNLDPDSKIILFNKSSSQRDYVKNPETARKSFNYLQAKFNKAQLLEISDVPIDRMPLYLNAADVLILTSLYEGSPNIVKEAMACNLPVVSVDCGDVKERLLGVDPGTVTKRNVIELAKGLEQVLVAGKRSNGREVLLKQGLSREIVANKVVKLYEHTALTWGKD
jgi:glycosyltransferase involved in cell wall biosynthesis